MHFSDGLSEPIEFLNDKWYYISWNHCKKEFWITEGRAVPEPELLGLGSIEQFLKQQEVSQGKKHDRHPSTSTGSTSKPASKRTREDSPIQEEESSGLDHQQVPIAVEESDEGQELIISDNLDIGLVTTLINQPTSIMSYAATVACTTVHTTGQGLFTSPGVQASGGGTPIPPGRGSSIIQATGSQGAGSSAAIQGIGSPQTAPQAAGIGNIGLPFGSLSTPAGQQ